AGSHRSSGRASSAWMRTLPRLACAIAPSALTIPSVNGSQPISPTRGLARACQMRCSAPPKPISSHTSATGGAKRRASSTGAGCDRLMAKRGNPCSSRALCRGLSLRPRRRPKLLRSRSLSGILAAHAWGQSSLPRHPASPARRRADGATKLSLHPWRRARSRQPRSLTAFGTRIVGGLSAQALFERLLQRDGSAMLLEEVAERLIGQLLERLHAVARQQTQRVPGLGVERDELADLARVPAGVRSMLRAPCHGSPPR